MIKQAVIFQWLYVDYGLRQNDKGFFERYCSKTTKGPKRASYFKIIKI